MMGVLDHIFFRCSAVSLLLNGLCQILTAQHNTVSSHSTLVPASNHVNDYLKPSLCFWSQGMGRWAMCVPIYHPPPSSRAPLEGVCILLGLAGERRWPRLGGSHLERSLKPPPPLPTHPTHTPSPITGHLMKACVLYLCSQGSESGIHFGISGHSCLPNLLLQGIHLHHTLPH